MTSFDTQCDTMVTPICTCVVDNGRWLPGATVAGDGLIVVVFPGVMATEGCGGIGPAGAMGRGFFVRRIFSITDVGMAIVGCGCEVGRVMVGCEGGMV